jgi:hypothetical protein
MGILFRLHIIFILYLAFASLVVHLMSRSVGTMTIMSTFFVNRILVLYIFIRIHFLLLVEPLRTTYFVEWSIRMFGPF